METSMPLLRHLDELRRRVFKAFAAVIVGVGVSFAFAEQAINYLASPIGGSEALVSIEVTENIAVYMRVALLGGVTLGMPFILYQAMQFILPGLAGREKLWLILGVPFASLLFAGGAAFTWFLMIPTAVPFLTGFIGITTQVRPASYFDFITNLMFWIGISFEMPIVFMLLARLKFVTARQLAGGWRYAVVAITIAAAAITPTVDPVNMGLVTLPLMGLYLISIVLAWIAGR
ncbi:MAG: twin-arginine translocase subunit TatC [Chloroflexi bacterium]|nr:twin-arginine translocase subunit TatC [Chloroflexota bacterium]